MFKKITRRMIFSFFVVFLLSFGFVWAFSGVAMASVKINQINKDTLLADPDNFSFIASDAIGEYAGTTTLSATLTNNGEVVIGEEITFTLNNTSFAGNKVVTDPTGTATLGGVSLVGLNADIYSGYIEASFTDHSITYRDTADLTVIKATPIITWTNPASIVYGTALSNTQLNAEASVRGSLVYSPSSGTILNAGTNQTLNVNFTPTETVNYNTTSKSVIINVNKATPIFSNLVSPTIDYGTPSINLGGNIKLGSLIPTGNLQITLAGTTHGINNTITIDASGDFSHNIDTSNFAVGPYQITYSYLGDGNFNTISDNSKFLTVINSNATITLSNLSQTYDGQPKWADYETTPIGLTVSITYDGSTTPPTNAGNYALAASITSAGYSGSANDTLIIAKVTPAFTNLSSPTITQGTASAVLGGNIKSVNLIPTVSISITLNGVTLPASIDATTGDFSVSFDTSALVSSTTPYPIAYSYNGDTNFNSISDNTFTLTVTPTGTPSPTPTNPPSSGGGGGGGGTAGSILASGFSNNTRLEINSNGLILSAARLTTVDGKTTLDIPYRTKLLSELGNPLSILTVGDVSSPPDPPPGNALLSAYTFGPEGAKFDPPMNLTMSYDPNTLPKGIQEDALFIAYWNGSQWILLESKVDKATHTVSAPISHFSTYSLLGGFTNTPTPMPEPAPGSAPDNEVIPSPTIIPEIMPTTTAAAPTITNIPEQALTPDERSPLAPTQTPPFSILIIIYVVVFIAVALLTVLFVSRLRGKA